jgi:hypothetical protein
MRSCAKELRRTEAILWTGCGQLTDNKTKIWKQYKMFVQATLQDNYPMYGYQHQHPEVADLITEAAVVTRKRLDGERIPLTKHGVLARLQERYRKKK